MQPDYLIIGSGLSALTFGALMANTGKTVQILEAHEHPGGFGHTFTMAKKYTFNAQFHYVWDCGEGQTVNRVLKRLGLDKEVTFERYDPDGFDHMRMPGYEMDIPSEPEVLIERLSALFPEHSDGIRQFVNEVEQTGAGLKIVAPPLKPIELLKHPSEVLCTVRNLNSTLQDVFDMFQLPQAAQTLLALQWLDFLLPPNQLSFFAWVALFRGYQAGAFYPTQHFEAVINSLVKVIESKRFKGEVVLGVEIDRILRSPDGVKIMMSTGKIHEFDRVVFATPPDQVMALLADPTAAETKRFADWKANHITSVVHQDAAMYDRFGIHQPSEFDFFQTDTRWGYNGYLNQLCGISSPQHYFLSFQLVVGGVNKPMIKEDLFQ